jgi:hypothetical protein
VKRTTTITVNGERWKVPRGFGVEYKRLVALELDLVAAGKPGEVIDGLIDLMLLIGYAPTREAVADWPLRKRVEAVAYAANVHLRASDNPIRRHPELPWLPKPWQGPPADLSHIRADLRGAFAGPTPTEIAE